MANEDNVQAQAAENQDSQNSPEPQAKSGTETPEQNVQKKTLTPLEENKKGGMPVNLNFLLDIPLEVSVEVGKSNLIVQELLQLSQGSIIELDKAVGEPFEVFINKRLIAKGEIVVVNERFGIRLIDIVTPTERVQQLQED